VLDTNLFVAAYWNKHSASADILEACLRGEAQIFYSSQIRNEIRLILRNIKAREAYKQEVETLLSRGTEVMAPGTLSVVTDDPDDDKFVECAMLAHADYLVTSDEHLLRLGCFGETGIVKPAEFRRTLVTSGGSSS
jgi:putative PIN family toxin of toxin-antitoxin system